MNGVLTTFSAGLIAYLACLLAQSAWHKWRQPTDFTASLASYRLVPAFALNTLAKVIPLAEMATVGMLLIPSTRVAGLIAASLLMASYSLAIASVIHRKLVVADCGCGTDKHAASRYLLIRNISLTAACVAALTLVSSIAQLSLALWVQALAFSLFLLLALRGLDGLDRNAQTLSIIRGYYD